MIRIITVGKVKEPALKSLLAEYTKRLSAYVRLEIEELPDEATAQNNSVAQDEQVKQKEGERILFHIREKEYVILLDLHGTMLDSVAFAQKLDALYLQGNSDLVFVIGGSLGVSEAVKQRANWLWKFSDLTFPHQLIRLFLVEQLYRAYKINRHEPYHK